MPQYNTEHHHSGLGLLTAADVHHGLAEQRVATRATVLATAYAAHPERFPAGLPLPPAGPDEVWINSPKTRATEETRGLAATRGGVLDHARPGSYSRPTVPTFTRSAAWRLRHEVSPVPIRESARVELLPGLRDALGRYLRRVRDRLTGGIPILQQVRYSCKRW